MYLDDQARAAMSDVVAVPEFVASAASDLAGIGSAVTAANAAAAAPTSGLAAAAADGSGGAELFTNGFLAVPSNGGNGGNALLFAPGSGGLGSSPGTNGLPGTAFFGFLTL
jgi:hypothetical protein